jgi:diketogulonate reductase-like aldo/keto reductase
LNNPVIELVANKYKKTNAQTLLKWAVQQEIGIKETKFDAF